MLKVARLLTFSFALPFLLLNSLRADPQDMAVRVEAIRLLEHANAVSRPTHLMPSQKQVLTFRAYGLDGTTKDGSFTAITSGDIEFYETHFGSYQGVAIHYPDKIVQDDYQPPPPEVMEMDSLAPLLIGQFDKSDTIHAITPANFFGRPAKCIQFETTNGRTHQSNEICVDAELGALLRWNVGEDLVEDSDYVSFEGVLLPRHIRHYVNGKLRMEIEQDFSKVGGPIDWTALTPANAHTLRTCQQYRRPIIQSAPQPAGAGAGPWYDVRVHGAIGPDGRIHDPTVFPEGRPDLERHAIEIVSSWVFSPPLCNGKPTIVNADLVVHFPPQ